jgi:hypothetical protein
MVPNSNTLSTNEETMPFLPCKMEIKPKGSVSVASGNSDTCMTVLSKAAKLLTRLLHCFDGCNFDLPACLGKHINSGVMLVSQCG